MNVLTDAQCEMIYALKLSPQDKINYVRMLENLYWPQQTRDKLDDEKLSKALASEDQQSELEELKRKLITTCIGRFGKILLSNEEINSRDAGLLSFSKNKCLLVCEKKFSPKEVMKLSEELARDLLELSSYGFSCEDLLQLQKRAKLKLKFYPSMQNDLVGHNFGLKPGDKQNLITAVQENKMKPSDAIEAFINPDKKLKQSVTKTHGAMFVSLKQNSDKKINLAENLTVKY